MLIGKTLGKYRIVEHLGTGGMAEVYKAYQPGLDRYVAIKVLHSFLATEEDFLTRFQREAKLAAMLRHPNIIQVYDFDYDKERNAYYMVMEFVDGPSLKAHLEKIAEESEITPLEETVRIITAIANALNYAHQRGMVHRDVKPANIMFAHDDQVILTDFGIAKMVNMAGLTASGAMVGTPSYMAPEQGMGEAGDERADIYSLGAVLYQLTTGRLPFDADTPLGVALKHINAPLPPPTEINSDLSPNVEAVIMRAMAKDPNNRYQTAKELATDLKRSADGQPVEPVPEEYTGASAVPSAREGSEVPNRDQYWEMATLPSAPAYAPSSETPPPAEAAAPDSKRRWIMAATAILGLILIGGCIAISTGERASRVLNAVLAAIVTPTSTPTRVAGTPTPTEDVVGTQVSAALATYVATTGVTPTPSATPTATPTSTPTPDLTATAVASCEYDLEVVRDPAAWPSGLAPGQRFVKRWEIRNSGTCAWPEDTRLVFVSGDELNVAEDPEIQSPAPGETAEIEIVAYASTPYNTYSSLWQLQYDDGIPIGEKLSLTYRVVPTPTPRPTETPSDTPTPAYTPTPTEELHFSVPVVVDCVKLPDDRWRGRAGLTAGGGDGNYRYYLNVVSAENEFFNGTFEFEWQQGQAWFGTVIVQSGDGQEARWQGALPYPGDDACADQ